MLGELPGLLLLVLVTLGTALVPEAVPCCVLQQAQESRCRALWLSFRGTDRDTSQSPQISRV